MDFSFFEYHRLKIDLRQLCFSLRPSLTFVTPYPLNNTEVFLDFLNAVLQSPWILFPSLKMWIPLLLETLSLVRLTQHPPCLFCVAGQISIVLLVLSVIWELC